MNRLFEEKNKVFEEIRMYLKVLWGTIVVLLYDDLNLKQHYILIVSLCHQRKSLGTLSKKTNAYASLYM